MSGRARRRRRWHGYPSGEKDHFLCGGGGRGRGGCGNQKQANYDQRTKGRGREGKGKKTRRVRRERRAKTIAAVTAPSPPPSCIYAPLPKGTEGKEGGQVLEFSTWSLALGTMVVGAVMQQQQVARRETIEAGRPETSSVVCLCLFPPAGRTSQGR